VKIQYSKTKADSERLALQFLQEKVVGFDMEWPWDGWRQPNKLQNKIGLIQVATEDKVALFHIGLHTGETTDDILAPSLRKLIESDAIGKIGVGILNADFARLSRYFKLKPKGAVELSHLHRLVTFGGRKPELVSTKLTSLANQVEQHLGHSLYKGDVRTSNWSEPLSQEQIKYAAGDAYAGIMLYHCLNYKRLQMDPIPPLPIHAEKYLGYKLAGVNPLYLEPPEEGGKVITSAFFFGVPTAPENLSKTKNTEKPSRVMRKIAAGDKKPSVRRVRVKPDATVAPDPTSEVIPDTAAAEPKPVVRRIKTKSVATVADLDHVSKALYTELCIQRKALAAEAKVPEYRVASDVILARLAQERPLSREALLNVRDVGVQRERLHGKRWIEVISTFVAKNGISAPEKAVVVSSGITPAASNETVDKIVVPTTPSRRRKPTQPETPESSPAFGTPPPPRTPQLHTGLSFTLAGTKLALDASTAEDSDDSLPSLDFGPSPARRTSGQKRKRIESPTKQDAQGSSQRLQHMTHYRYEEGVLEQQPIKLLSRLNPAPIPPPVSTSTAEAPLTPLTPLTPRSKIFHNKLVAFSRQVAIKQQAKADDLLSIDTLHAIVRNPPQTHEQLRRIPGVERFFHVCTDTNIDLLAKIQKFMPAQE
jgi:ribonuclease D